MQTVNVIVPTSWKIIVLPHSGWQSYKDWSWQNQHDVTDQNIHVHSLCRILDRRSGSTSITLAVIHEESQPSKKRSSTWKSTQLITHRGIPANCLIVHNQRRSLIDNCWTMAERWKKLLLEQSLRTSGLRKFYKVCKEVDATLLLMVFIEANSCMDFESAKRRVKAVKTS